MEASEAVLLELSINRFYCLPTEFKHGVTDLFHSILKSLQQVAQILAFINIRLRTYVYSCRTVLRNEGHLNTSPSAIRALAFQGAVQAIVTTIEPVSSEPIIRCINADLSEFLSSGTEQDIALQIDPEVISIKSLCRGMGGVAIL
jgi:hypothetical protein